MNPEPVPVSRGLVRLVLITFACYLLAYLLGVWLRPELLTRRLEPGDPCPGGALVKSLTGGVVCLPDPRSVRP